MLVDLKFADEAVAQELREMIDILEGGSRIPMWFIDDPEKDQAAVNHLIHCMKVVSDFYSNHDDPKFFDYSSAR
jgi:hypothetical protein